jgi:hypothetical protein
MQFALLIYESPQTFLNRKNDEIEAYTGAWRTYYKALVDAGVRCLRVRLEGIFPRDGNLH